MTIEIDVDKKRWNLFLQLPESARKAHLSQVTDDSIHETLDSNPELLQWNIQKYSVESKAKASH